MAREPIDLSLDSPVELTVLMELFSLTVGLPSLWQIGPIDAVLLQLATDGIKVRDFEVILLQ